MIVVLRTLPQRLSAFRQPSSSALGPPPRLDAEEDDRAKVFDQAANDRLRVAGMHLCFPAIGHVAKRQQGYEFIEQMWETSL